MVKSFRLRLSTHAADGTALLPQIVSTRWGLNLLEQEIDYDRETTFANVATSLVEKKLLQSGCLLNFLEYGLFYNKTSFNSSFSSGKLENHKLQREELYTFVYGDGSSTLVCPRWSSFFSSSGNDNKYSTQNLKIEGDLNGKKETQYQRRYFLQLIPSGGALEYNSEMLQLTVPQFLSCIRRRNIFTRKKSAKFTSKYGRKHSKTFINMKLLVLPFHPGKCCLDLIGRHVTTDSSKHAHKLANQQSMPWDDVQIIHTNILICHEHHTKRGKILPNYLLFQSTNRRQNAENNRCETITWNASDSCFQSSSRSQVEYHCPPLKSFLISNFLSAASYCNESNYYFKSNKRRRSKDRIPPIKSNNTGRDNSSAKIDMRSKHEYNSTQHNNTQDNLLLAQAFLIPTTLILSGMDTLDGIRLSADQPRLCSNPMLNINRPAVLRQYFGETVDKAYDSSDISNISSKVENKNSQTLNDTLSLKDFCVENKGAFDKSNTKNPCGNSGKVSDIAVKKGGGVGVQFVNGFDPAYVGTNNSSAQIISRKGVGNCLKRRDSSPRNCNCTCDNCKRGVVWRTCYGLGSGTDSVGIHPRYYVTREMTAPMKILADRIYRYLLKRFRSDSSVVVRPFNHCTVLLYYHKYLSPSSTTEYSDTARTKKIAPSQDEKSSDNVSSHSNQAKKQKSNIMLSYHTDNVYSHVGKFRQEQNSQMENTFTAIFSLGDERTLNFRRQVLVYERETKSYKWSLIENLPSTAAYPISENVTGSNQLNYDNYGINSSNQHDRHNISFCMKHNSLFLLHPQDERPMQQLIRKPPSLLEECARGDSTSILDKFTKYTKCNTTAGFAKDKDQPTKNTTTQSQTIDKDNHIYVQSRFQHGGVKFKDPNKLSVALVFRTVVSKHKFIEKTGELFFKSKDSSGNKKFPDFLEADNLLNSVRYDGKLSDADKLLESLWKEARCRHFGYCARGPQESEGPGNK